MIGKTSLVEIVIAYMRAIEAGSPSSVIAGYYDQDAEQVEFPNLLTKTTVIRDGSAIVEAYGKGAHVLSHQAFEILNAIGQGNTVVIEAVWTGTLAVPIGRLAIGDTMKAYFAQVFEFRGTKILKQRNYDCFEPFM